MTFSELKEWLKKMVQERMKGSVIWAEQYQTQPPPPLTTLKLKDTGLPVHPVNIVKDGKIYSYYECEKILEINRYTPGVTKTAGEIRGMENTAEEDLTSLLLYVQSDRGAEKMYLANISIRQMGPIRDLTALESTRYKNRAMLELSIRCTLEYQEGSIGVYAPEAGTPYEEGDTGYFEDVEMEGKNE
ncbi:hypothetical protein D7V94_13455 [Parablautia intestinalis]|uniref:Phage neck terminator protein gp12-like domain-containing protein n=1 Tax=Parablautia intestinalis TaxID=2320100 RepID=A0A3A9AVS8_9FIRM|nr:hypothetical protein [Parablautia intestinalis]RKI90435.1 hypothetical protein D7V94_13455 [Parablautia intestinalis]